MGQAKRLRDNGPMRCKIVDVGRRRDGGTKYWCLAHHANATAKYGVAALKCVAADDPPIKKSETLDLDFADYPGGVALWGSVPAVYDTTTEDDDHASNSEFAATRVETGTLSSSEALPNDSSPTRTLAAASLSSAAEVSITRS